MTPATIRSVETAVLDAIRDPIALVDEGWRILYLNPAVNPFEEQFHLPARLVKEGDGESRKIKVVRQENEPTALVRIVEADTAKRVGIMFQRGRGGEDHGVIGSQPSGLVDGPRVTPSQQNRMTNYLDP
jgi:hypothetical protein